ncbi:MAG: hypothetical protein AAF349_18685 [Cyanobacteria bacterium P01_A01_bin.68]
MIRRLALTVGFAILGAVAFSPKAHGQAATPANEEVTFEGNVGDVCTLTDVEPGTLGRSGDLLSANPNDGGSFGKVTVNCSGPNEVSVGAPSPVNVPSGFTPNPGSQQAALLEQNGNELATSNGPSGAVTPGGDIILNVDMRVINGGGIFPSGVYEYNVPVTAAPN